jgi:outer membrane protein assembly factor BamB
MRRTPFYLALVLTASFLVACGSDGDGAAEDDRGGGGSDDGGSSSQGASDDGSSSNDDGEFRFLVFGFGGIDEVDPRNNEVEPLFQFADHGIGPGVTPFPIKYFDGAVWFAAGPGKLIAVDLDSGDAEEIEFASTQQIADYAPLAGLVWVEVGLPYSDAVVLGIDRESGEILHTIEAPEAGTLAEMSLGPSGLWINGGDATLASAVTHVDPATGAVLGVYDAGLVVRYVLSASDSAWVGGRQFIFEGREGTAVVRLDPATGEVLATIEVGKNLGGILEHGGWIWAVDTLGEENDGAQLYRIDPATNTVLGMASVGQGTTGSVTLIAAGDHVLANNSQDGTVYAVDAATGEGDFVITGPGVPIGVR